MRLKVLLVVFAAIVGADSFFPDLEQEIAALRKRNFLFPDIFRRYDGDTVRKNGRYSGPWGLRKSSVAYAALHGMNLSYHEAVTSDGWILQLWRVRSMKIYDATLSSPVILSHGFGGSAFDFLWYRRNESAAFIFADNGYDVWIANYRGNHFSNRVLQDGKRRKPNATEYYRTAWQYMADRDLPCVLDKVLSVTSQPKVYLIGYSMGGTIPFAFLSENHSYDDKISHYASLAPVLRLGYDMPFSLIASSMASSIIVRFLPEPVFRNVFGTQFDAYPEESLEAQISSSICDTWGVCSPFAYFIDRDMETQRLINPQMNKTRLPIFKIGASPGLALMSGFNFAVSLWKDRWTKIDFSSYNQQTGFTNMGEYGTDEPPEHDFAAIKVPFSLLYVENDDLMGPESMRAVIKMLNATDFRIIHGDGMRHIGVVLAADSRCYIYNDLLYRFNKFENGRGRERNHYRSKVAAYLKKLPFGDGCIGKTS